MPKGIRPYPPIETGFAFIKNLFLNVIDASADQGARGIILGCTEIPLLVHEKEGNIPLFDTTLIHATTTVEYALL